MQWSYNSAAAHDRKLPRNYPDITTYNCYQHNMERFTNIIWNGVNLYSHITLQNKQCRKTLMYNIRIIYNIEPQSRLVFLTVISHPSALSEVG